MKLAHHRLVCELHPDIKIMLTGLAAGYPLQYFVSCYYTLGH